ncbi:KAP family P-loop NTPase fold protein [Seonamhaeicola marinus]|uniref:KAP NTPase domain-containing protein n=1 Tax=Seonamhaeicola marinus TaxID=1912246 RepID=A0A5D0HTJ3_9FLAO|nr:P-loop NTPase fold protein [Seonamhaeicola marinus]TYA74240.1 hypothetical protein FUA24_12980 [Seonamhaeicola marinus]
MKNKKENLQEFQFISESPLTGHDENPLQFGHDEIVRTLKKIVKKSPESFTIGLYGDWGSGKSTIALTLRDELEKDSIPLVLFDVWKHEGDALRRTFLCETHYFFKESKAWKNKYKGEDSILDELTKSKKSTRRIPLTIWQIIKASIVLPLSFLALFFFVWLIFDLGFGVIDFKKTDIPNSIAVFLGLFPISFLFKFVQKLIENIKGEKEEYYQGKIEDPTEFESKFKEIINKLNSDIKKVVFVFDNLDRVSGEKAVQIMATIKTFLDPIDRLIKDKNIVFLIPCDESAIKRHLKKTLNYSDEFNGYDYYQYAGEYLRKFFNTILWIPEFYTNELEELAKEKLKETKIKDFNNEELSALIVLVFDKNPRQIIQFINILISNYLLIKERPIEGFSLKNDIAKLAKFLLLIQKFPEIMDVYKETLNYDLNELPGILKDKGGDSNYRIFDFQNFLRLTEHVKIESLDLFFKLRRSKFESKIDNSVKLIKLIETDRISDVVNYKNENATDKSLEDDFNYIDNLNLKNKLKIFSQIIDEKLLTINNSVLLAKFIDGLLTFTKFKEITLESKTYRTIYHKLNVYNNHLSTINPINLIKELYDKMPNNREKPKLKKLIVKKQSDDFAESYNKKE